MSALDLYGFSIFVAVLCNTYAVLISLREVIRLLTRIEAAVRDNLPQVRS